MNPIALDKNLVLVAVVVASVLFWLIFRFFLNRRSLPGWFELTSYSLGAAWVMGAHLPDRALKYVPASQDFNAQIEVAHAYASIAPVGMVGVFLTILPIVWILSRWGRRSTGFDRVVVLALLLPVFLFGLGRLVLVSLGLNQALLINLCLAFVFRVLLFLWDGYYEYRRSVRSKTGLDFLSESYLPHLSVTIGLMMFGYSYHHLYGFAVVAVGFALSSWFLELIHPQFRGSLERDRICGVLLASFALLGAQASVVLDPGYGLILIATDFEVWLGVFIGGAFATVLMSWLGTQARAQGRKGAMRMLVLGLILVILPYLSLGTVGVVGASLGFLVLSTQAPLLASALLRERKSELDLEFDLPSLLSFQLLFLILALAASLVTKLP